MGQFIYFFQNKVDHFFSGSTLLSRSIVGAVGVVAVYLSIYIVFFSSVAVFNAIKTIAAPPAWYSSSWGYRKLITIPSGNVTNSVSNFPIPIVIDADSDIQAAAQSDGDDIIFVDHSGVATQLAHELSYYDSATGQTVAWVNVPTLTSASDNEIYMYYGNGSAVNSEDPDTVWADYSAVWHFDEDATDELSSTQYFDSVGTSNSGSQFGTEGVAGNIYQGQEFDGTDDVIMFENESKALIDGGSFYYSFWINKTSTSSTEVLFAKGGENESSSSGYDYLELVAENDDLVLREVPFNNGAVSTDFFGSVFTATGWYHIVFSFTDNGDSTSTVQVYVNGSIFATASSSGGHFNNTDDDNLFFGYSERTDDRFFTGIVDEMRYKQGGVLTADWISNVYNSTYDPASYISLGIEEEEGDLNSVVITSLGSGGPDLVIPSTDNLLQEVMVIQDTYGSKEVQEIVLEDVEGNTGAFENLRLYYDYDTTSPYDCNSESYAGTESQFGSNAVIAGDTFTFTGSANISTVQTACFYMVLDVDSGATDGAEANLEFTDFDTNITLSKGSVDSVSSDLGMWNIILRAPNTNIVVGAIGSENDLEPGNTQYVGGAFTFVSEVNTGYITGITITESGAVNAATSLNDVRLYYEYDTTAPYNCSSESFEGNEPKFGVTDTTFSAADGVVTFTGSVTVSPTQSVCTYVVMDNSYLGPGDTTYNLRITDTSTDITASIGVQTNSNVSPSGTPALIASFVASEEPWYDSNWGYRKQVNILDAQVDCSDEFYEFPIFVGATDTDVQSKALSNIDDIFFTNKFGTKISHEIESYNSSTGELNVWVEIPHLYCDRNTPIYMYYGNSGASNQEDVAGTWSNGFEVVHHFEESTTGATDFQDSTTNGVDSNDVSFTGTADPDASTIANGGVYFDGTDDYIDIGDDDALDPSGDATFDVWINLDDIADSRTIFKHENSISASPYESWKMRIDNTGQFDFFWYNTSGSFYSAGSAVGAVSTSTWHKVTGVVDGNSLLPYVDADDTGWSTGTKSGSILNGARDLFVGRNASNGHQPLIGYIDEFRVVSAARSKEWLTTEYNNLMNTFLSFGSEEALNSTPSVTSVSLNGGSNISLTEDTTTTVTITAQVSDVDGYADISSASAVVYRSGVGSSCSVDELNCYSVSCSLSNCAGNSCDVSCSADLYYFAQPTDSGIYSSEDWLATVTAEDTAAASDSATSPTSTTELNTLVALNPQGSISYGTVDPGTNTGATNATLTVENTGNVAIDLDVSGSALCTDYPTCSGGVIPVANQEYLGSAFTYGAGISLSGTPTRLNYPIAIATNSSSPSTDLMYWGIAIPTGIPGGSYTGVNTITALED